MNIQRTSINTCANDEANTAINPKIQTTTKRTTTNDDSSMNAKLRRAAQVGNARAIEQLVQQGAEINKTDSVGWTPLHFACNSGHAKAVNVLLAKGAEVSLGDNEMGATPLHLASHGNDIGIATSLLKRKRTMLHTTTTCGETPLFIASKKGKEQLVALYLSNGARVDFSSKNGTTPLLVASQEGHMSVIQVLLAYGAKVDLCNQSGETPLFMAIQNRHFQVAHYLLQSAHANPNRYTLDGASPLFMACLYGQEPLVDWLLHCGANVNASNGGSTALHVASQEGHLSIVKLLLSKQKRAHVNAKDENGATCLYAACEFGHLHVAKALLAKGADVNAAAHDGSRPLDIAQSRQHAAVIDFLVEAGATAAWGKPAATATATQKQEQVFHDELLQLLAETDITVDDPIFDSLSIGDEFSGEGCKRLRSSESCSFETTMPLAKKCRKA